MTTFIQDVINHPDIELLVFPKKLYLANLLRAYLLLKNIPEIDLLAMTHLINIVMATLTSQYFNVILRCSSKSIYAEDQKKSNNR